MAANFATLPAELYGYIFAYLLLPDLEAINLASKSLHGVVHSQLQEHRQLNRQWLNLRADYRHASNDIIVPWFQPLANILRNPVKAFYVRELDTELEQESQTRESYARHCVDMNREPIVPGADIALIKQAALICQSDWFDDPDHPEYKSNFMQDVDNLEQSALLAILVCHLPNLRQLTLTAQCGGGMEDAPWLQRLAKRVHFRPDHPLLGNRPFSRLEHVTGDLFNGSYGLDFETTADFIALPSVRRIETPQNQEAGFDWPAHLPRSNVREILLNQSSIERETIVRFATQALQGPCLIRQKWGTRRHDSTPEATWTRLEIPFKGAKAEDYTIGMDPDSDNYWEYDEDDMDWEIDNGRSGGVVPSKVQEE